MRSSQVLTAKAATAAPRILAVVATGLYLWLFLRLQWRVGDEGSIVYGAARVAQGSLPYRDFFEVMGPGTFYWLALWFKALGTSWLTSRVAVLVTALVSACAIYYATTRRYRGKWAVLPAALYTVVTLPLWPAANHHFDSNMWVLLAFAISVSAPQPRRKASVLTGVLAGLASTIMPQKGLLLLAGLCIARLIDGATSRELRRAVVGTLWMVGPFMLVGTSVCVFFWWRGAFSELIYANVIWPATRYHSVNVVPYGHNLLLVSFDICEGLFTTILPSPVSHIATAFAAIPIVLIAVLPFAAIGLMLNNQLRWKGLAAKDRRLPWCYWCAGFALFVAECHRLDITHLAYGSPILLIAVIGSLSRARMVWAILTRRLLVVGLLLFAAVLGLTASLPTIETQTRSGKIQLLRQDEALNFLYTNVSAGEEVFVYPYYPMYYFLANVRNPTRYSILMYHINTPEQFDEVIQDLDAGQVKYVLWDTLVAGANLTQWFPGYQDPPADEQRLERYFDAHYRIIGVRNGFRILQRM